MSNSKKKARQQQGPPERLAVIGSAGAGGDSLSAVGATARRKDPLRPISSTALGELTRQLVLDAYAPASVLINAANEILFFLGPIDNYFRLAPGRPTHDMLSASRQGLRQRLVLAIDTVRRTNARSRVTGRMTDAHGGVAGFSLDVLPVLEEGDELLLVCITEAAEVPAPTPVSPDPLPQLAEKVRELETSWNEQQATMREMELSRQNPVGRVELLASISRALAQSDDTKQLADRRDEAVHLVAKLTPRQHQIMTRVVAGQTSKDIAADLGLSRRTVESHRVQVMRKTGATSMPALARLAMAASAEG
jgi:two-component system CheB/CheR fusion protein